MTARAGPPLLVSTDEPRERPWASAGMSVAEVDGGNGWAIYEGAVAGPAPVAALLDDTRARIDFTAPGPSEQVVRLYGTERLLP